jgi:hypothetical protein
MAKEVRSPDAIARLRRKDRKSKGKRQKSKGKNL